MLNFGSHVINPIFHEPICVTMRGIFSSTHMLSTYGIHGSQILHAHIRWITSYPWSNKNTTNNNL